MTAAGDRMLVVNARIQIPLDEFQFTFARSSGPGGQNVNKVNSKAVLRWPIAASASVPDDVRKRFLAQFSSRVTTECDVVIASQRFRDQARNVADCLEKLRELLVSVAAAPRKRKRTRPSRGSIERRLRQKRQRSEKKGERRSTPWHE